MNKSAPQRTSAAGSDSKRAAVSRRDFMAAVGCLAAGALLPGCRGPVLEADRDPIIDIHQHLGYRGRPDAALLAHQRALGVTLTILLPAGRPLQCASTHNGSANGLEAGCAGDLACYRFADRHHRTFRFGANEVPDIPQAIDEIRRYLNFGGVIIGEQKFGVDCDSAPMQKLYQLAADYQVPILMHWQEGSYNFGFDRFYQMLEKYPHTIFIGHAQTWWANLDKNCEPTVLYPKGKITPGGLTDKYLSDYPNVYGDLSAGSGFTALTRDPDFTRDFLNRHQDKLLFGSDCCDWVGTGSACQGAETIAAIRRLAPSRPVERKLLYHNAHGLFRL
jgi:predicted TIM-barrel fold metal-dependent hydrolase